MNLPNKLTVFRIILVPIMVIVPFLGLNDTFLDISIEFWIMNIIFIIASITDKLDGYLARSRNEITTFGKFLDPLADKILVLAAMMILVEKNLLPAVIPIIVMTREFLVSGYRLVAVQKQGKVVAANIWGKLKTVTQMSAIIAAFININNTNSFGNFVNGNLSPLEMTINIITTVLMVVSTVATIFSGWSYLKGSKELLKD